MIEDTQDMLKNIIGEDAASNIFDNMFPEPITGYKIGKILTIGELKKLSEDTVIHLWYIDEDGNLRNNDFVKFSGYDGNDELSTQCGFPMPIYKHSEDELIENFDNSGWTFTVCEAIKQ